MPLKDTSKDPDERTDAGSTSERQIVESVIAGGYEVDRETGTVRGLALLGPSNKGAKRDYTQFALEKAVSLFEGVPYFADSGGGDHRNYRADPPMLSMIGLVRNPRLDGNRIRGDVKPLASHREWFLDLAEESAGAAPDGAAGVGNSPKLLARVRDENGREIVEEVTHIKQVDLVSRAGTLRSLWEGAGDADIPESEEEEEIEMPLDKLTFEELAEARPDLVEKAAAKSTEELSEARKELDELKAEKALRAARDAASRLVAESALPQKVITESFLDTLVEAGDEERMEALIREREELVGGILKTPESYERPIGESGGAGETEPADLDTVAAMLKQ